MINGLSVFKRLLIGRAVYPRAGIHGGHPRPISQHGICRLSQVVRNHCDGWIPASPTGQPGGDVGAVQRSGNVGRIGRWALRGIQRQHHLTDSIICGWIVHVIHSVAGRNDGPSPSSAVPRMAVEACRQHRGNSSDCGCHRHCGHLQVHGRRLDTHDTDTAVGVVVHRHPPSLRCGCRRTAGASRHSAYVRIGNVRTSTFPSTSSRRRYRPLSHPLLRYIDRFDSLEEGDVLTVVLPEFVVRRWWEHVLQNQSALWLKARLLFRPNTVVVSVPVSVARRPGRHNTLQ